MRVYYSQGIFSMKRNESGSKIDAEVLFRCSEDLIDSIGKQSRATKEVNESLKNLNSRIDNLEESFYKSSESSGKTTKALNWLTFALALIAVVQAFIAFLEYIK